MSQLSSLFGVYHCKCRGCGKRFLGVCNLNGVPVEAMYHWSCPWCNSHDVAIAEVDYE